MSLNLVFHLVAAGVLLGLVYLVLLAKADLRFQQQLWANFHESRPAVFLGWPEEFLGKLSRALGFPLVWRKLRKERPVRIDKVTWLKCHIDLEIRKLECYDGELIILTVRKDSRESDWQAALEKSLSHKFRIVLNVSDSSEA